MWSRIIGSKGIYIFQCFDADYQDMFMKVGQNIQCPKKMNVLISYTFSNTEHCNILFSLLFDC